MILLALAKNRCRSLRCMPRVRMGSERVQVRPLNMVKVPMEMRPLIRNRPPTSSTAMDRDWEKVSIKGLYFSHSSEAVLLASLYSRFFWSKRAIS